MYMDLYDYFAKCFSKSFETSSFPKMSMRNFLSFDVITIFCILYFDQSALKLLFIPSCVLEKSLVFRFSQNI